MYQWNSAEICRRLKSHGISMAYRERPEERLIGREMMIDAKRVSIVPDSEGIAYVMRVLVCFDNVAREDVEVVVTPVRAIAYEKYQAEKGVREYRGGETEPENIEFDEKILGLIATIRGCIKKSFTEK